MLRKGVVIVFAFFLACAFLLISILRSTRVQYEIHNQLSSTPEPGNVNSKVEVNYNLAYPGKVLPDHPLWPLKVVRDKIWLAVTADSLKKAEIYLLLADKRLASFRQLFEEGKCSIAVATLEKAEIYLTQAVEMEKLARTKGTNTADFLDRLSMASLKHREIMEEALLVAMDDSRPLIVKAMNYPKDVYSKARDALLELGKVPPQNPFER